MIYVGVAAVIVTLLYLRHGEQQREQREQRAREQQREQREQRAREQREQREKFESISAEAWRRSTENNNLGGPCLELSNIVGSQGVQQSLVFFESGLPLLDSGEPANHTKPFGTVIVYKLTKENGIDKWNSIGHQTLGSPEARDAAWTHWILRDDTDPTVSQFKVHGAYQGIRLVKL